MALKAVPPQMPRLLCELYLPQDGAQPELFGQAAG